MNNSISLLTATVLYASTLIGFSYTITIQPGFNLIANHYNHTPNNRLGHFFVNPDPPDGSLVFLWNKAAQTYTDAYQYVDQLGWFHSSNPDPLGPLIHPGEGFLFFNPLATSFTETITGTPGVSSPVTLPLNSICLLSHQLAAPATFQDIIGSPPAAGFCTRLYRWDALSQKFVLYSSPGTLTATFPVIPVGESVFIVKEMADLIAPTLVSATITSPNTILVEFNELMNPGPATFAGNYILSGGPGSLGSVSMYPVGLAQPESKLFQLNISGTLSSTAPYVLKISGLTDLCGNLINPCTQIMMNCTPPANDVCANATVAVAGANSGTVMCATTDGYSAWDTGCPGPDVWYKYTPPCNGQLSLSTCGSPLNTVVSVWDGCPVTLGSAEIWGDNDSCTVINEDFTLPFDVSSCQTYYIRVSGANGAFGTFTLNVGFTPGSPFNDACANATVIGNGVFPFDNCGATPDGPGAQPMDADVWFRYTPTCGGPVYVNTCGSSTDTALAVYSGSCGGALMGFNNNAAAGPCNPSSQSYVTFTATALTTYYIRVGSSPGAAAGCGKLTVVGPTPPSGTCPPGIPSQGGTGGNVMMTRMFQVTGNSTATPWAWCISAPCCYSVQEPSVAGVLPVGAPPSALIAAFVASINSKCTQPPTFPYRLTAAPVIGSPDLMTLTAWGCYSEIIFSVGPAGAPCQNQCVVPNPFDHLPTAGPCSFNPPLVEIPLSKQDCNTNGVDDLIDILEGTSSDADGNRIPDECETCARPHFVSTPTRQQVKPGQRAVLNGEAQGGGILSYQWLLNGSPLPGATDPRLVIDPVRAGDAGEYQVAVNYGCGQLRSAPASLALTGDTLQIAFHDGRIEVSWTAANVFLQSAPRATGEWTTLSNAVNPTIISPPFTQQFFRLIEK